MSRTRSHSAGDTARPGRACSAAITLRAAFALRPRGALVADRAGEAARPLLAAFTLGATITARALGSDRARRSKRAALALGTDRPSLTG
jgi:hypothetical protein